MLPAIGSGFRTPSPTPSNVASRRCAQTPASPLPVGSCSHSSTVLVPSLSPGALAGARRIGSPSAPSRSSRCSAITCLEGVEPLEVAIRVANHDTELEASAWLRAVSFYVHPEERKFSGQLQRLVKAQEEFQLLKERNVQREFGVGQDIGICLVAVLAEDGAHGEDTKLLIDDGRMVVLGTLDVVVARALQGQALIGNAHSAAYLANVCVSSSARRRGVGQKLVDEAVQIAQKEGVDCVYVHIYASNTIGRRFYESCGFVVEQEEDLNMARRRGQNMDGQPGSGRTVLMKFVL